MSRRSVLRAAAGSVAAVGLGRRLPVLARATPAAIPAAAHVTGYVFNAAQQSVTLFDPATLHVTGTFPIGAIFRWLSNEQRFWDGSRIWSYDFPQNKVLALAFDPTARKIDLRLPTGGTGPSHSLMLSADNEQLWLNIAGGNEIVVLRKANGEVLDRIATGAYP